MTNLEKIQKAMKVFQIIAKIVTVFSFVAIAFTLVAGSVSLMADKLPFVEQNNTSSKSQTNRQ